MITENFLNHSLSKVLQKMEKTNIIELKGVAKYYEMGDSIVKALDGVDITIEKGDFVAIMGPSGSGKSTGMNLTGSLDLATKGEIYLDKENIELLGESELAQIRGKKIGFIFQQFNLIPNLTAKENVMLPMLFQGVNIEEREDRAEEILKKVDLDQRMDHYPNQLSGGQQQRICIGRAIVLKPRLIVCDEAVSALDVSVQAQVLNLLADLKDELQLSYLFISHDLSVIRHICDRVVVLYLGKVAETASVKDLFSRPKHPYTQALLSAAPKNHPREKKQRIILTGEIPSPLHPPTGCPFHTRCPVKQAVCTTHYPPHKTCPSQQTGENTQQEYYCIH